MRIRVLVSGTRNLTDDFVIRKEFAAVDQYAKSLGLELTLVHGAARGVDTLAANIAAEYGWEIEAFPADWDKIGKGAGFARNIQMVKSGVDMLIAFPKGDSPGTRHTIEIAKRAGVRSKVIEL